MLAVEPVSAGEEPLPPPEELERLLPPLLLPLTRELLEAFVALPRLEPPSFPIAVALGPDTPLDFPALLWTVSP
jgi:hypothetical protein